jgi:hypothetical protein
MWSFLCRKIDRLDINFLFAGDGKRSRKMEIQPYKFRTKDGRLNPTPQRLIFLCINLTYCFQSIEHVYNILKYRPALELHEVLIISVSDVILFLLENTFRPILLSTIKLSRRANFAHFAFLLARLSVSINIRLEKPASIPVIQASKLNMSFMYIAKNFGSVL